MKGAVSNKGVIFDSFGILSWRLLCLPSSTVIWPTYHFEFDDSHDMSQKARLRHEPSSSYMQRFAPRAIRAISLCSRLPIDSAFEPSCTLESDAKEAFSHTRSGLVGTVFTVVSGSPLLPQREMAAFPAATILNQ
jgi:hypothetical protein